MTAYHGATRCRNACPQCESDADCAVIARIGGNLYRERIASGHWRTEGPLPGTIMSTYSPSSMAEIDRYVAGDAESLYAGNSYRRGQYSPPFTYTDGRTDAAVFHGFQHIMSRRPDMRAMLPESAFDWPVYRFGIGMAFAIGWPPRE